jgi:hypothetical protein
MLTMGLGYAAAGRRRQDTAVCFGLPGVSEMRGGVAHVILLGEVLLLAR